MATEPKPSRNRAAHQLPPGKHGLSRRDVEANQRERILESVVNVVSLVGYAALSVEDIVAAAGVSRRTFYDNFKSKEAAFRTAYDEIGAEVFDRVRDAYDASETFAGGVVDCLNAFIEFAIAEPAATDVLIVEVLAAGPAAIERRNAVMKTLAQLLHNGASRVPGGIRPPDLIAETIVGGIYEIIYSRVLQGEASRLHEVLPDLAYSMMLPYLGHDAADRELRQLAAAARV